uniref:probable arginine--tRNA ligase, mitochondrial n=1 Tax=Osmia lignaria TaxID=473952 RepID=UPI001479530C|nr:probable arginine--tRNA ligase, mitochondrial [Osmia lignaria]XP_034189131.1 probable arginine--tRNA ligase, mitochondrial [Osmia lignaria]XP_034189132.1 probable arginine--tRNA ligase, mitochondrial [Osmia lignaria]XP_034189133.1 probable arginine--tRNA ligase, mitochondrial [Osmia lignaria]XP_034189134.1 probable arginine--tRNA ligase, mitochondrial [Osmia lignaria]
MSNCLRSIIFKKVIKPLQNIDNVYQQKLISNLHVKCNQTCDTYCFMLPLKSEDYNITNEIKNLAQNNIKSTFDDVIIKDDTVYFNVSRDKYLKAILESNFSAVAPPLVINNDKNVIVEFSSPNIAKPFHFGHLRSTIIGNCIANINTFLQNQVEKINYLGDWGTQFGFIQLGIEMTNIEDAKLQTDPIKTLYQVYVTANKLAESNPTLHERAKEIFKQLELGDSTIYKNWQRIRHYTVKELEKTYKRIGVVFDKYEWESMYTAKNIQKILDLMEERQLLTLDNDNRKVIAISNERTVPIIKSDDSSLYITRDIAAAINRFERYKFDAMYYVVDYSQTEHFNNLIQILNKMQLPWVDRLKHVKYGRIHGMSTRKGTAVFLEDILNEAKEIMRQKQINTKTTKVSLEDLDSTSDILGISGIIVYDLKQNRMNNYEFNWNSILNMKGDSGIKLQYTHCRLCSLERLSNATLVTECDPSLLKEPEVDNLITLISQFDEVIIKSYEQLEPCILTVYLLHLCKAINVAMRTLRIKGESVDLGNQRLLLFHVAKIILARGMKLLGLTPLEEM